jgi:hypothetical protein
MVVVRPVVIPFHPLQVSWVAAEGVSTQMVDVLVRTVRALVDHERGPV